MNRFAAAPWSFTLTDQPRVVRARAAITPKRVFDFTLALLALVFLAPLLLVTALLIRLESRGPVLFCQTRYGWDNRPFRICKFRTMWAHMGDARGARQTVRDDPRVTRLGAFLRKTNIDELPQLFNVLKGDMSLVGPRPHALGTLAGGMLYEDLVPSISAAIGSSPALPALPRFRAIAARQWIPCMRACACASTWPIAGATA